MLASAHLNAALRAVALAWSAVLLPVEALAQRAPDAPAQVAPSSVTDTVDSLIALALAVSPQLRAARARLRAADARLGPAGARPDPVLMAGVQNVPISAPGFSDFMSMKMIGVGQAIPYPGKLTLATRAAEREVAAVEAELAGVRLAVESAVKEAYYELAYTDRALEIVTRNRVVLLDLIKVTETRYESGAGGQEEVLRLRVEVARLGEEAVAIIESRRATLARLNAVLGRPSDDPVAAPVIPGRVARAAVADSAGAIRFTSSTLGARAADSPIPALERLQTDLAQHNPALRALRARIEAQRARAELAQKEHLPDVDVTFLYGQRNGMSDMFSAQVSVPIPLQRGRKQDRLVVEARSELDALEAEHEDRVNTLRAEVAGLHADLERGRSQLALYVKAILPQGRATLASATSGYQVGRTDLLALLEAQATLFHYETNYYRALSDFAKTLAELERVVGQEIVP